MSSGHENVAEDGMRLQDVNLVLVGTESVEELGGVWAPNTEAAVTDCRDHHPVVTAPVDHRHSQRLLDVLLSVEVDSPAVTGRHLQHSRVPAAGPEAPDPRRAVFAARHEPELGTVGPLDAVHPLGVRLLLQHLPENKDMYIEYIL